MSIGTHPKACCTRGQLISVPRIFVSEIRMLFTIEDQLWFVASKISLQKNIIRASIATSNLCPHMSLCSSQKSLFI